LSLIIFNNKITAADFSSFLPPTAGGLPPAVGGRSRQDGRAGGGI